MPFCRPLKSSHSSRPTEWDNVKGKLKKDLKKKIEKFSLQNIAKLQSNLEKKTLYNELEKIFHISHRITNCTSVLKPLDQRVKYRTDVARETQNCQLKSH
ncbi:hypothetical protein BpHYR1_000145 [Brachionus plicatilis]|uniref:Uncharacterized protein n=1 Tax=Brachionus plicatilis TaxID=10195 RepID=A0A3M7SDP2_BRAPC|nr:hypothetical protein BpHYR1_000145 [Brachionus plicatilis]